MLKGYMARVSLGTPVVSNEGSVVKKAKREHEFHRNFSSFFDVMSLLKRTTWKPSVEN